MNPVVDDDFRRHCSVGAISHGTLTIHVDNPGLVAAMRVRWAGTLLEVVRRVQEFSRITRITFTFGNVGASFRTKAD